MYYNRILQKWIIDPLDYFLLSSMLGRIAALRLKDHLSEEKAMQRLKDSMIKEREKSMNDVNKPTYMSKKERAKRIYNFARGGKDLLDAKELLKYLKKRNYSNNIFKLSEYIKSIIENLAYLLKRNELKNGLFKFLFTNARVILELLLHQHNIYLTYCLVNGTNDPRLVVLCSTTGLICGFGLEYQWPKVAITLFGPPFLLSILACKGLIKGISFELEYNRLQN